MDILCCCFYASGLDSVENIKRIGLENQIKEVQIAKQFLDIMRLAENDFFIQDIVWIS